MSKAPTFTIDRVKRAERIKRCRPALPFVFDVGHNSAPLAGWARREYGDVAGWRMTFWECAPPMPRIMERVTRAWRAERELRGLPMHEAWPQRWSLAWDYLLRLLREAR